MKNYENLIFEVSQKDRVGYSIPKCDVPSVELDEIIPAKFLRESDTNLPEVSEIDIVRHYTNLSNKNFGVDTGFYPLGSCTMKYNPKINENIASDYRLTEMHPYQPEETAQGCLQIMYELQEKLGEITGMDSISLQPAAGAHGELAGLMIIKSYHQNNNDLKRKKIIIPNSAHGTNPASAAVAGFDIVEISSDENGCVDIDALTSALDDEVAGLMLTNPNTLGIFEQNITKISKLIHDAGGLLYYDGANANAIMGITRPGDMGFDIVHLNLHKTFSSPHGGGGPGSGPIGVKSNLTKYLPAPIINKVDDTFVLDYDISNSIGRIKSFYGNFAIMVRTYTYILTMGAEGLKKVSENAVLNANYLMKRLKNYYYLPMDQVCKHEFVLGGVEKDNLDIATIDVAKRLLDYGYHPPTIYFPLIIPNALMIEPTETESKETLDAFADAMIAISKEAKANYSLLKDSPYNTPVRRLDEVTAARKPIVKWSKE